MVLKNSDGGKRRIMAHTLIFHLLVCVYYACVHVYLSLSLCLKCSQQAVWSSLTVD